MVAVLWERSGVICGPLIVVAVWERSGVICGPLIVVAVLWERSGVICAPSHSGGCIMGEVGCDMCSLS